MNVKYDDIWEVKDIPNFEKMNTRNTKSALQINVFELTGLVLTLIHINTNYDQPQVDLLCMKITIDQ